MREKNHAAFFPTSAKYPRSLSISVSRNFSSYGSVCSASACQTKEWVRISPSSDFFEKAENIPVLSGRLLGNPLIVLQNDGTSHFYASRESPSNSKSIVLVLTCRQGCKILYLIFFQKIYIYCWLTINILNIFSYVV